MYSTADNQEQWNQRPKVLHSRSGRGRRRRRISSSSCCDLLRIVGWMD